MVDTRYYHNRNKLLLGCNDLLHIKAFCNITEMSMDSFEINERLEGIWLLLLLQLHILMFESILEQTRQWLTPNLHCRRLHQAMNNDQDTLKGKPKNIHVTGSSPR